MALAIPPMLSALLLLAYFLCCERTSFKILVERPTKYQWLAARAVFFNIGAIRLSEKMLPGIFPMVLAANAGPEMTSIYVLYNRSSQIASRLVNLIKSSMLVPLLNADVLSEGELFSRNLKHALKICIVAASASASLICFNNEYFVFLWTGITHSSGISLTPYLALVTFLVLAASLMTDLVISRGGEGQIRSIAIFSGLAPLAGLLFFDKLGIEGFFTLQILILMISTLVIACAFSKIYDNQVSEGLLLMGFSGIWLMIVASVFSQINGFKESLTLSLLTIGVALLYFKSVVKSYHV